MSEQNQNHAPDPSGELDPADMGESLSMQPALSAAEIAQVRQSNHAYINQHAIPLVKISREIGYTVRTVSAFLAGTYPRSDRVARVMKIWMERDIKRRQSRRSMDYVTTAIAEQIRAIIHLAILRQMMAAIVAPSGVGKTYVMKAMASETNGIFLSVTTGITPRELLLTLAGALGRREVSGSRSSVFRWIVKTLAGSNRPIFMDEAHKLTKSIGTAREIHDATGCPIIMAGTLEILGMVDDRADGNGQFASRTICFNAMDAAANVGDPGGGRYAGARLFTVEEIERFFASRKINLTPDALRLAWTLACLPGFGSLRSIEHAAGVAMDINPGLQLIARADLVAALQLLHGADFPRLEQLAKRMEPAATAAVA